MTVVKISKTAHRELLDALTWIAQDSPENALRFINELQDKVRKVLEVLPLAGRPLGNNTRYVVVSGRVVVYEYRADSDEVVVLHFHGPGEDWQ